MTPEISSPPWKHESLPGKHFDRHICVDSTGVIIAEALRNAPLGEHDMNLISAAPDLLEACKALMDLVRAYSWELFKEDELGTEKLLDSVARIAADLPSAWGLGKVAIAKAEGKHNG